MASKESFQETLTHFRQQREKKLQELQALDFTIRQLESELGVEISQSEQSPSSTLPTLNLVDKSGMVSNGDKRIEVRPDEFYGMTHAEAAREYLKKVGHAISFDEMADAFQRGGAKLSGTNSKRVLYISLVRNARDFAVPQKGFIGLREFYPRLKSVRPEKPVKARRAKARPRRRKNAVHPEIKEDTTAERAFKELRASIIDLMSDEQVHVPAQIAKTLLEKGYKQAQLLRVYGILRDKRTFEKADGGFRLLK